MKLKLKTSTPIVLDDVKSAALKHRINLNIYNAGNKMTLERGSEKPMAGVITSENQKNEEQIPENRRGTLTIQIFFEWIPMWIGLKNKVQFFFRTYVEKMSSIGPTVYQL